MVLWKNYGTIEKIKGLLKNYGTIEKVYVTIPKTMEF